jgi:ferric-dicitrate binding protein FerR (iron transport regulator)
MLDSGVDLTVTKGHVELASFATAPGNIGGAGAAGKGSLGDGEAVEARVPVYSGQHATVVNRVRLVEQIDARGIERKLSWREGRLIFDDDPLTDVVSEISRYTSARIVISDPSIRNLKIGGYFKVQDIDSILDTLQESFGIEVRKDKDNAIYLSRGPAAQ